MTVTLTIEQLIEIVTSEYPCGMICKGLCHLGEEDPHDAWCEEKIEQYILEHKEYYNVKE